MALFVSRFAHLPHSLKVVSLILNLLFIITLLKSPTLPGGSSIVWFTVAIAIIFDVAFATLLLLELEIHIFPIKIVTYASAECGISLMLSIFYFMCTCLIIGEGEILHGAWFIETLILCLLVVFVYVWNFMAFLRQWMAEQRASRSQANLYDDSYSSYGAP